MNFKQAEAAIRDYFNTGWNDLTPIAWPDLPFNQPSTIWVRFTMKNNIGEQVSIGDVGNNYHRRQGIVTIQIFQPQGQGTTDARTKADVAADIFIENALSGMIFKKVNARDIGADGQGWYQYNVTAEYQYDRLT